MTIKKDSFDYTNACPKNVDEYNQLKAVISDVNNQVKVIFNVKLTGEHFTEI